MLNTRMSLVHKGVLIPDDMRNATSAELDAYAEDVVTTNGAFVRAYFKLADKLAARGIDIDELGDTDIAVRTRGDGR